MLFVSLVSVWRIAKFDEYRILFDGTDTFLSNKFHGQRIGLAEVHYDLYYLQPPSPLLSTHEERLNPK